MVRSARHGPDKGDRKNDDTCVYIHMYMHVCIYIERERDKVLLAGSAQGATCWTKSDGSPQTPIAVMCLCIYIYIHTHIYI